MVFTLCAHPFSLNNVQTSTSRTGLHAFKANLISPVGPAGSSLVTCVWGFCCKVRMTLPRRILKTVLVLEFTARDPAHFEGSSQGSFIIKIKIIVIMIIIF